MTGLLTADVHNLPVPSTERHGRQGTKLDSTHKQGCLVFFTAKAQNSESHAISQMLLSFSQCSQAHECYILSFSRYSQQKETHKSQNVHNKQNVHKLINIIVAALFQKMFASLMEAAIYSSQMCLSFLLARITSSPIASA